MSPQPDVGPHRDEQEFTRLCEIQADAFAWTVERIRAATALADPCNARVIRRNGDVVGGLVLLPMGQWFGGCSVGMAGVSFVAVAPEFRAQGVASQLLGGTLRELREAGTPLSTLWPATLTVYRRSGYETAGVCCEAALPTSGIDVRDRSRDLAPAGPDDETDIRAVYAQWARATPGSLDRNDCIWARVHQFHDHSTRGYVVRGERGLEGYVFVYPEPAGPFRHDLRVHDVVAATPAAARCLLTFLADHRSVRERVLWKTWPADPLLGNLAEAPYTLTSRAPWMLRIVHVPHALAARGYPDGLAAELHLNLRDELLPGNNGRFVLEVADRRGTVRPGGRGTFDIHIRGLAALYSGFLSPRDLVLQGLLVASEPELNTAAALFAGPMPWLRDAF